MACLETTAEQRLIRGATTWYECSMSKQSVGGDTPTNPFGVARTWRRPVSSGREMTVCVGGCRWCAVDLWSSEGVRCRQLKPSVSLGLQLSSAAPSHQPITFWRGDPSQATSGLGEDEREIE